MKISLWVDVVGVLDDKIDELSQKEQKSSYSYQIPATSANFATASSEEDGKEENLTKEARLLIRLKIARDIISAEIEKQDLPFGSSGSSKALTTSIS